MTVFEYPSEIVIAFTQSNKSTDEAFFKQMLFCSFRHFYSLKEKCVCVSNEKSQKTKHFSKKITPENKLVLSYCKSNILWIQGII